MHGRAEQDGPCCRQRPRARSLRRMPPARNKRSKKSSHSALADYDVLLADVARVIEEARRAAARSVNAVMTATYWLVGRRIVEQEQRGSPRAGYGEQLLKKLASDLSNRFGRGFSERNLQQMRTFYLGWPISQTTPAKSADVEPRFPLPWSHYVRLLAVRNAQGRAFDETEAFLGGWTSRQLESSDPVAVLRANRLVAKQGCDGTQGQGSLRGAKTHPSSARSAARSGSSARLPRSAGANGRLVSPYGEIARSLRFMPVERLRLGPRSIGCAAGRARHATRACRGPSPSPCRPSSRGW